MKLTAATSSLAAVLVATVTATLTSMTVGVVSASSSSAVSATATTLSHRATAAKRSLLDINDPNDHELHAKSDDDDELAAMTTAGDDELAAMTTAGDDAGQHRRRLEYSGPMVNVTADFAPLACNAALACDATGTIDLSVAMASPQDDGSVLLECGKCYRVDQTGDISIPGGLNIE